MNGLVLIRGGGDLASGVALRLARVGLRVLITELPRPLAVRRLVSFCDAVYSGEIKVEDVIAQRAEDFEAVEKILKLNRIPVLIDPEVKSLSHFQPLVLVDGRMTKMAPDLGRQAAPLVIGLGPGFIGGENCHAAIETNRGHRLGRVLWEGAPQANTGTPDSVGRYGSERVLRAPAHGPLKTKAEICDQVEMGELIAEVDGIPIHAPFKGVLRGLLRDGLPVKKGLKIGDLDPRNDPSFCRLVSDKSLAIGGGVLEAMLTRSGIRAHLWD
jgi:xanthine dehydrogenase accessory factor